MRYLLDSDSLSDLYEPESPGHRSIAKRAVALPETDLIVISILALYELEYGYGNAPESLRPLLRERISAIQEDAPILQLSPEAALTFGSLKARLRSLRQLTAKAIKAHNVDIMLAATAIVEGCTLVSADGLYSDLQQLDPALQVEKLARLNSLVPMHRVRRKRRQADRHVFRSARLRRAVANPLSRR